MKRLTALAAAILLLAAALPAAAYPNFGARAGFTRSPDQIHLGGHAELIELSPGLVLLPNVEVGLGDERTVWALGGELAWTIANAELRGWRPYVGGGLGLFLSSYDAPPGADGSQTDIGATVLFGMAKMLRLGHKFFAEVKFGIEDAPDVKVTAGLTFF